MATNSFLFKGWAVTVAAGLSAFAAVDQRAAVLTIALMTTALFWGLDGYYLWLERGFIKLHKTVKAKAESEIDFNMEPDKTHGSWFRTCFRPHIWIFYGAIIAADVVGIILVKGKS
jgi:hypothetical protein